MGLAAAKLALLVTGEELDEVVKGRLEELLDELVEEGECECLCRG